jgi:hypothetical protein
MATAPPPPGPPAPAETPPEVNTETVARFRRQSWWQVTFPVLFITLLAVAGVVLLIVLGGPAAVSIVADYSLWLLITLAMAMAIIPLAIAGGLAYLMFKLIAGTPPITYKVQAFMEKVYKGADDITDRIANVVITVRSVLVGAGAVFAKEEGADGGQAGAAEGGPQPTE